MYTALTITYMFETDYEFNKYISLSASYSLITIEHEGLKNISLFKTQTRGN